MNNQQFRKLLTSEERKQEASKNETTKHEKRASALGGEKQPTRAPMMPRTVKMSARSDRHDGRPTKRFKSSAPKGSNLASGFTDRTKARAGAEEEKDEKAERIHALEQQMKDGEITLEQFETMREEITGGDISSTHLIKGLDRRLLDRVRRGEDVLGLSTQPDVMPEESNDVDVDEELDKLEDVEVQAVQKEKTEKKGVVSKTRTRDDIMAELKAQRKAAVEARIAAEPVLDNRWRRTDEKTKTRIEIDKNGREVLIMVDEDGVVKKMVRKTRKVVIEEPKMQLDPDKDILGAAIVVPEPPMVEERQAVDDDDIFEDAGTDYNPLGPDLDSDAEDFVQQVAQTTKIQDVQPQQKRNYFQDTTTTEQEDSRDHMAGIRAVIEKASKLAPKEEPPVDDADAERRAKHAKMLANKDRDMEDMDMGFGESRFEDADEEDEGEKVRLSEWKGGKHLDDEDDEVDDKKKSEKKKRKPKKRKGDANNISDIMGVIERRKDKKK